MDTTTPTAVRDVWARALARAIAAGLDVLVEPISGAAFVESETKPGTLYAVSAETCSCPTGRNGRPCKHAACYRAQAGLLPLPPDDSQPAPAVVETCHCATCGRRVSGLASFCCEECAVRGPLAGAPGPIRMVTIAA